jgi:hypothetical protein
MIAVPLNNAGFMPDIKKEVQLEQRPISTPTSRQARLVLVLSDLSAQISDSAMGALLTAGPRRLDDRY